MGKVRYEEMFPWEIAAAMAAAPICYLPLGVLEWHGEHAAVGLDGIKAHAVCVEAAERFGGLVVPPLWWGADERDEVEGGYLTGGIERGERYHVPGSMFWIRQETFSALLADIYEAMRRRGFRAIVVVAGHWSRRVYLPTLRESGETFLRAHPGMRWLLVTDRELVPDMHYPHEHAAGGEISVLMAIRPDLVDLDMTFGTAVELADHYRSEPEHLARRAATSNKYIGVLTGVDDASNDPETTASAERGRMLLDAIAERLAKRARELLEGS